MTVLAFGSDCNDKHSAGLDQHCSALWNDITVQSKAKWDGHAGSDMSRSLHRRSTEGMRKNTVTLCAEGKEEDTFI